MANTVEGKAVAARNATTHGLFCRQAVLPHLGESPDAYQGLLDALLTELPPRNLMDRQYIELWAEASWKLRRLGRWEAQIWENDALDEDALFAKMERVTRLQATLRRQLDKAVRMLQHEVPALYADRLRREVLMDLGMTEHDCRRDKHSARTASRLVHTEQEARFEEAQERLDALNRAALDNAPADAFPSESDQNEPPQDENGQNELPPDARAEDGPNAMPDEICQNELLFARVPAESTDGDLFAARAIQTFSFRQPPPPAPPARRETWATIQQFARSCARRG